MHLSFILFADAANISQEGKLNILGVFDAVHAGPLPAVHPRATVVVRLKATAGDVGTHPLTLRWVNPRGVELWSSTAELSIQQPPVGMAELDMPVIAQLDLPLDLPGEYRMVASLRDRTEGEARLQVHTAPPMPSPPVGAMVS
jgi:hypothetical protein